MNPLKDHPELFANGEFSLDTVAGVKNIIGYHNKYICQDGTVIHDVFVLSDGDLRNVDQCTLVARKISDMTDEEKEEFKDLRFRIMACSVTPDVYKQSWKAVSFLLERGVYPFSRSHFDDGTVIDINKIQ